MSDSSADTDLSAVPILPDTAPVAMPELPPRRVLTTMQEFKAVSDELRSRILGLIQQQPATAKQIAKQLDATPGAIGHHLHLLEDAGLAQIVARRFVRGTVANYYTRTARIFVFDFPADIRGDTSLDDLCLRTIAHVRDELIDARASDKEDPYWSDAFLHLRLTPERADSCRQRLRALIEDMIHEAPEPAGKVYSVFITMFTAPDYLQADGIATVAEE